MVELRGLTVYIPAAHGLAQTLVQALVAVVPGIFCELPAAQALAVLRRQGFQLLRLLCVGHAVNMMVIPVAPQCGHAQHLRIKGVLLRLVHGHRCSRVEDLFISRRHVPEDVRRQIVRVFFVAPQSKGIGPVPVVLHVHSAVI